LSGQQLEIIAEFEVGTAVRFGFELFKNETNAMRVLYNTTTSQLITTRSGSGLEGTNPISVAPLAPESNRVRMHIFVDRSSVEVFGNDGLVAITNRVFPEPGSEGISIFAEDGSVKLLHLEVYSLDSIWSDSETIPSE
ncbi:MAG: GH32 C-terminal domain-containing protein, partial [Anaerolineae bacterium]|nr:GH32 C-terminal domain-containing protein [Anaerolineae bacterium]